MGQVQNKKRLRNEIRCEARSEAEEVKYRDDHRGDEEERRCIVRRGEDGAQALDAVWRRAAVRGGRGQ